MSTSFIGETSHWTWELLRQAYDDLDNTPGAEGAAKEEVSQFQTLYNSTTPGDD